jgi:hypothetical protein
MDAARLAMLRLASKWEVMRRVAMVDGGAAVEHAARAAIAGASAVGLLRVERTGEATFFEGGRAAQTLWLSATEHGLSLQPFDIVYLFSHLERTSDPFLDGALLAKLSLLERGFRQTVDARDGALVMLFRVTHAPRAPRRSLRLSVDDVLSFAESTGSSSSDPLTA